MTQNLITRLRTERRTADNKVLSKWGLNEVTEPLCYYETLLLNSTDSSPHCGNTQLLGIITDRNKFS